MKKKKKKKRIMKMRKINEEREKGFIRLGRKG